MTDKNEQCRAIILRALAELEAIGFEPEGAAACFAIQGIIRIDDPAELTSIAKLASESAEALSNPESLH